MSTKSPLKKARNRLYEAAIELAMSVHVADLIENDPTYEAERTAEAEQERADMFAVDLYRFREAVNEVNELLDQ